MAMHFALFAIAIKGQLLPSCASDILVERIGGEYSGIAKLRCSLFQEAAIDIIQWRKGPGFGKLVYYDNLNRLTKKTCRGEFEGRNVKGYALNASSYLLVIKSALPQDMDNYKCLVKSTLDYKFKASESIWLNLVAPPDKPPAITDLHGVSQNTSNCSDPRDLPTIAVHTLIWPSLVCSVGGSQPYPTTRWDNIGNATRYKPSFCEYQSRGTKVRSAKEQIDFPIEKSRSLKCTVTAPDATSGKLRSHHMCLRVVKSFDTTVFIDTPGHFELFFTIPVLVCILLIIVVFNVGQIPRGGLGHVTFSYLGRTHTMEYVSIIHISVFSAIWHIYSVFCLLSCSRLMITRNHNVAGRDIHFRRTSTCYVGLIEFITLRLMWSALIIGIYWKKINADIKGSFICKLLQERLSWYNDMFRNHVFNYLDNTSEDLEINYFYAKADIQTVAMDHDNCILPFTEHMMDKGHI